MSFNTWTPLAVSSEAHDWQRSVWRIVEAQHIASTMKIVDSQDEQDLLETLLESSKPVQPAIAERLDYLLITPFRYTTYITCSLRIKKNCVSGAKASCFEEPGAVIPHAGICKWAVG